MSNMFGLIGISAVLPEDRILKKQAFVLDHIVCDNMSLHIVSEGNAMTARHLKSAADVEHRARLAELRFLRDKGIVSPLDSLLEELGVIGADLNELRSSSEIAAVKTLHGPLPLPKAMS